jgi:hypothetical protein
MVTDIVWPITNKCGLHLEGIICSRHRLLVMGIV